MNFQHPKGSVAVTQSDGTDDPAGPFIGFYVGSTGGGTAITFVDGTGASVTWPVVTAGLMYMIQVKRVKVTGTTASSIFGLTGSP